MLFEAIFTKKIKLEKSEIPIGSLPNVEELVIILSRSFFHSSLLVSLGVLPSWW